MFKKSQIFSILLACSVLLYFSCGNSDKKTVVKDVTASLWKQNCSICHGKNGKLGINGAKDLSLSELSLGPRIEIIAKGKGVMTPFENALTKQEIEDLAKYTFTFK